MRQTKKKKKKEATFYDGRTQKKKTMRNLTTCSPFPSTSKKEKERSRKKKATKNAYLRFDEKGAG